MAKVTWDGKVDKNIYLFEEGVNIQGNDSYEAVADTLTPNLLILHFTAGSTKIRYLRVDITAGEF